MKRILLIVIIVIAVVGAIGAFFWFNKEEEHLAQALEAVPPSADLILEFADIRMALTPAQEVEYADLILSSELLSRPLKRSILLDSLLRDEPALAGASVLHSFHQLHGDSSTTILTVLRPKEAIATEDLEALVEALLVVTDFVKTSSGERSVFTSTHWGISATVANGLLILTDSPKLLTQSLEALETGRSRHSDKRLQLARASAGKNVQMNMFAHLPSNLFRNTSLWHELGDWIALDVSTRSEGPVMNGFTYSSDSLPTLLSLFRTQKPQELTFLPAIPLQVSSFLMFGASDIQQLQKEHAELLRERGTFAPTDEALSALNIKLGLDVRQQFYPWMGSQFGTCVLSSRAGNGAGQEFALFQVKSTDLADQLLHGLARKAGADSAAVRALPLPGLLEMIFGVSFKDVEANFFARHNDFVIFGSTAEAVQGYLHQLQADRTLATDVPFDLFMQQFSSTFNVFSFQRLPKSDGLLRSQLSSDGTEVLHGLQQLFGQLPSFGAQFSSTGEAFYTNMHWQFDPEWDSRSLDESAAKLDAAVVGRPIWMLNHLSHEPEILVQDANNMLYLLNQTGQELFRRQLTEAIVGEATQVDPAKNGELTYLFCTNNQIHHIDRNGKDVKGFPIELESPVSAPMLLIDYDGKREYRMIVPCKNKRVYNYGIDGQKVKGWKFDKTKDPIMLPITYLSDKKKDYILAIENDGDVHLLDRTGGKRSNVKDEIELSDQAVVQAFASKEQKHVGFYVTDKEGAVRHIGLDGKVASMDLGKHSPAHHFLVADLNGDGNPEFILSDLNVLKVFNSNKKLLFEQRLEPNAAGPFIVELAKNRKAIGVAFGDDAQVMLYDMRGDLVDGFPLSGATTFDVIGLPTGQKLVVAGIGEGLVIHTLQ